MKTAIQEAHASLLMNGFEYRGTCPCGNGSRTYVRSAWKIKVIRTGYARLYYNNKIITDYVSVENVETLIGEATFPKSAN